MMKWKNSPQKKLQEVATAKELTNNDLSNIMEQKFRIIVIKLIAGLEKSVQNMRIYYYRDQGTKKQSGGAKNAINELQNKMEVTTARTEEAEERIGELEHKIMEEEEAEKKRDKKNPGV